MSIIRQHDIMYNTDYTPKIENGDFVIEESTDQNVAHLLVFAKGEFRANPIAGVGMINWIESEGNYSNLKVEIQSQIELDGMKIQDSEIASTLNELLVRNISNKEK